MTQTEAYDLACTKMKDPAVTMMGDQCIIGEWVNLSEFNAALCVFLSKSRGVRIRGAGKTWKEAAKRAGLLTVTPATKDTPTTNTRMATVQDVALAHKERGQ